MTGDLAAACATIARLLPVAEAMMTEPDTGIPAAATGHGRAAKAAGSALSALSHPPWNPAAASAVMDAHEGLRRLEASLRRDVTGKLGRKRPGSDANTMAALEAIEALGCAVTASSAALAARILDRWSRQIQELPAVDEAERPQRIPAACPYCHFPMLRVFPRSGQVTCLRWGACFDADGRHPVGTVEVGRLSPQVRWQDGLVAP